MAILPNLSKSDMDSLITRARINLLITFQETGVKLKLLNSLSKGAFCIVNKKMITRSGVDQECIVADSDREIIDAIEKYSADTLSTEELMKRIKYHNEIVSDAKHMNIIKSKIN